MTRRHPEQPSPEELSRKTEAVLECLKSDTSYAGYTLTQPGEAPPEDEPNEILGFACVYPPRPGQRAGDYLLLAKGDQQHRLPSRQALRRGMLSYQVRPGAMDEQSQQLKYWDDPIAREFVLERSYEQARSKELPISFVVLARTAAEDRLIGMLFHPPQIPSTKALEMLQAAVEGAMGEDV